MCDFRVSQQLDGLEQVSEAWHQFDVHLAELQMALRSDHDTLLLLDSALRGGTVSSAVASSVRDVARVLSEKQDRQVSDGLEHPGNMSTASVTIRPARAAGRVWPDHLAFTMSRAGLSAPLPRLLSQRREPPLMVMDMSVRATSLLDSCLSLRTWNWVIRETRTCCVTRPATRFTRPENSLCQCRIGNFSSRLRILRKACFVHRNFRTLCSSH